MRAVGVDISDHTLAVAELGQRFGAVHLRAASFVPLPIGAVEEGMIKDFPAVVSSLNLALQKATPEPIDTPTLYFCMPEGKGFTHVFSFPRELREREIEDAIRVQFDEYFPFTNQEAVYDWKVIQQTDQTQLVLVTSCMREHANQYHELAAQGGKKILTVDLASASAARSVLPPLRDLDAALLLHCRSFWTSLSLFDEEGLQMTLVLQMGEEDMIRQISTKLDVDVYTAEQVLHRLDLSVDVSTQGQTDEDQRARLAIQSQLETIRAECERMIRMYEGERRKQVRGVYMVGSHALMKGLVAWIQQGVIPPVQLGDPLHAIKHHAVFSAHDAQHLASAIGLARGVIDRRFQKHRFNLLPVKE